MLGRSARVLIGGAVLAYGGYRLLNREEGSGIVTRLAAAEIEQQQSSVSHQYIRVSLKMHCI